MEKLAVYRKAATYLYGWLVRLITSASPYFLRVQLHLYGKAQTAKIYQVPQNP